MVNEWLIVIAFLCEKHHFYGQVLVLAQSKKIFSTFQVQVFARKNLNLE